MASSGRFQSQLFSALSQRSLKWRDRLQRLVRQAKLASLWGVQIVIYPIYVVFQTGRLLDRQLKTATRRVAPPLQAAKHTLQRLVRSQPTPPPPEADAPIRHVLQTAKLLIPTPLLRSLQESTRLSQLPTDDPLLGAIIPADRASLASTGSSTLTVAPAAQLIQQSVDLSVETWEAPLGEIQGIASLLSTRSIVLTTSHNHILDMLTAEQQHHLRHRMIWEVAALYYYQRQTGLMTPSIPSILPLPVDRPALFPPVRTFRRLMAWMQTSDIALATNLFQEVALVYGRQQKFWTSAPLEPAPIVVGSIGVPLTRSIPDRLPEPWMHPDASEPRMLVQPTPLPSAPIAVANPPSPIPIPHTATAGAGAVSPIAVSRPAAVKRPPVAKAPQAETAIAVTPYIDTKATLVKYEKHPLEQLLLWLDSGMLWVEEKVAQVFRWFGKLFK
jgi:hypothetical protein